MSKTTKSRPKNRPGTGILPVRLLGGLKRMALVSLPYLFSLALVGVLFGSAVAYAINSPTFRLEEVKILNFGMLSPAQAFGFCELQPGENLVTLDLVNVQQMIKSRHPEFKEVLVRRVLPNRLEVLLKRRTPAAQLHISKYIQVDRDLVVLPGSAVAAFRNLTTIEGVPMPRGGLQVGTVINDAITRKAIRLSEAVKRSGVLRRHALTKIDISDANNITLTVNSDIEIRMGGNHFSERLKILDQTLKTVELDRNRIKYIDLRFDDVVIGPR